MSWKAEFAFGLAALLGGGAYAQAQAPASLPPPITKQTINSPVFYTPGTAAIISGQPVSIVQDAQPPGTQPPGSGAGSGDTGGPTQGSTLENFSEAPGAPESLGPTPLGEVGILHHFIYGDDADKAKIKFSGWMDFDYTFRSTSPGINNIAPVMNRFGDEALTRQLGLYISKPLDPKDWSWGFNSIFIAGADASFLGPTAGGWANTNPRFGSQFTDLNLTAHLPILTEGGVDVKAGRQTTVLGPMGALPWQRYFDSSDYAWYNLEEGRFTGVTTNWHITKRLSWYNGVEIGGWGVFYDNPARGVDYITQINYWLDEEAKKTQLTFTVVTGPTGFTSNGNTTAVEATVHENWNKYLYQVVSFQANYSKAPIFFTPAPGYQERAYDVYSVAGYHLTPTIDVNTRGEWYRDVDGGGYPGGFGIPKTDYYETTLGIDYHPTKCLQFRPEVRYDYASNPAFGELHDKKKQLSIAAEVLIKF